MTQSKLKNAQIFYLLFCLLGLVSMLWSAWHWYQLQGGGGDAPSFCNINAYWNCDRVSLSSYGAFLGIPLGFFGSAYIFFLGLLSFVKISRRIHLLALAPGVLVCLGLAAVLLFKLQAGCLVCFGGYISIFGMAATAFFFRTSDKLGRLPAAGCFVLSIVFLSFMAMKLSSNVSNYDPEELKKFKAWFHSLPVEMIPGKTPFKKGAAGARIQIVEFSDFGCPFCAKAAESIVAFLKTQPDVEFNFYPLPLDPACNKGIPAGAGHRYSCDWTKASICFEQQGKFWPLHDKLFEQTKSEGALPIPKDFIGDFDIDQGLYNKCMGSEEAQKQLEAFVELADKLKVQGTPTFFINGKRLRGFVEMPLLRIILEELR